MLIGYAWSILCQFPVLNFWLDHNGSRHIYDCTTLNFLQVAKRRGIFRLINSGNKLTTDKIVQRIIAHRYAKALSLEMKLDNCPQLHCSMRLSGTFY